MSNRVIKAIRIKRPLVPFDELPARTRITAVSGCSYLRVMEANRQGAINSAMPEAYEAPPKNLFAEPPDYNDCLDYF